MNFFLKITVKVLQKIFYYGFMIFLIPSATFKKMSLRKKIYFSILTIWLNFSKSYDQLYTGTHVGTTACSLYSQAQFYITSLKYNIPPAPQVSKYTGLYITCARLLHSCANLDLKLDFDVRSYLKNLRWHSIVEKPKKKIL